MRTSPHLRAFCLVLSIVCASPALAQKEIVNATAIASARTVYFEDKSGVDAVGKKASAELSKWGRFQIEQARQKADLIVVLSTDPHQGGNLIVSGGQTATIDSQGHVEEDSVPAYNKLEPVRHAFLTVKDARSGETLWESSERWGGLLTGFDSVGERLVKEFEKQTQLADERSRLKLVTSVHPTYPPELSTKHIEGTVTVRVVVNKSGTVTSAKAVSGPAELFQASVDAAKQWQFEPPERAPITTDLEMKYELGPKPCAPGIKGSRPTIEYALHPSTKPNHPGQLKILEEIDMRSPPYPEKASEEGIEGDLELFITVAPGGDVVGARVVKAVDPVIDNAAIATVRTWKFKVSRGEQAGFPVDFRYRLACSSSGSRSSPD